MNKIRRVLAVVALLAVLFIAGFTIAQWQGNSDTHGDERPPAGATGTGADAGDSSPSGSTPTTAPGDKSSDATRTGGDESTHIDKPGESK